MPTNREIGMSNSTKSGDNNVYFTNGKFTRRIRHSGDWAKVIETQIVRQTKKYARQSVKKSLPEVSQMLLDSFVKLEDKKNTFKYNDYLGAVLHGYRMLTIQEGQFTGFTKASDSVGKWGKPQTITKGDRTQKIFRLLVKRHAVYKHVPGKWRNARLTDLIDRKTLLGLKVKYRGNDAKVRAEIRRLTGAKTYNNYVLNYRGRNYKGTFSHMVYKPRISNSNLFEKVRVFHPGVRKDKWHTTEYLTDRRNQHLSEKFILHKRTPSKDVEKKDSEMFRRYRSPEDWHGRRGWAGGPIPTINKGNLKTGFIIYNAAPYANKLQRQGYDVLPRNGSLSQNTRGMFTRVLSKQIGKNFDQFMKTAKL